MSVEFRLHKPVMIVYIEDTGKNAQGVQGFELKVQEVSTLGEAAALEHEHLSKWASRVQEGGYAPPPWAVNIGSPTMQLLANLYEQLGYAGKVTSHEDPILPKEERDKIEMPEIVTREWLAEFLHRALKIPVAEVTDDQGWYETNAQFDREALMDLMAFHGKSAKKDMIVMFTSLVKKLYDEIPKGAVVAVGVKKDVTGFKMVFRACFKMKT